MEGALQTRVVDTAGAAKSTLVSKDPVEVCWVVVSAETAGTSGLITVYDGFDANGRLVLQLEPPYVSHPVFISPISCDQGLFVYNDANIACYTIAFKVVKR